MNRATILALGGLCKALLTLFVALTTLTTASVTAAAAGDGLLIWADENRIEALQPVAETFSAQYGVPVQLQEMAFGDIRDKLAVSAPAGDGPDIIVGAHDWLGQLVSSGLIAPIDLGENVKDFETVAIDAFTYSGTLYGVPYATEADVLIYNKALIPTPPATFDELIGISERLTDRSESRYGFLVVPNEPYHMFPILSATGGYVFGTDEDGVVDPLDVGLANAGAVRGASLLRGMMERGLHPEEMDYNTMVGLFVGGDVGMMINGPWELPNIQANGIDYGVAKIPSIDRQPARPFVGVQGFMVSAFSDNELLAQLFLSDYIATEETMLALFEQEPRPPAYTPTIETVSDDPDVAAVAASAADGIPMPSVPEMASVWTALADALTLIANGDQEPAAALEDAVSQIRTTIQRGQ